MPESIYLIAQGNLKREHLSDDKHVKNSCIGIVVKNIKDSIRKVTGYVSQTNAANRGSNNYTRSFRKQEHDETNNTFFPRGIAAEVTEMMLEKVIKR